MGAVVVSTTPAVITSAPTCRVNPIDQLAKIKITFDTNRESLAADLINQGELDQLGDEIMSVYNKVSQNCYETHQRMMINNSFVYEYKNGDTGFMDTYWDPYVVCNNSCPSEDPLFGVDTPDLIVRVLQDFDPKASMPYGAPDNEPIGPPSDSPTYAPTAPPLVPIDRDEFLEQIDGYFS